MATYNGERYIAEQLQSILIQLSANDEVIVVDDASTDGTPSAIRRFADSRICLIENDANQGVTQAFGEALSRATGSLIFLSDQDDLWEHNKIEVMIEAFQSHPEVTIVLSDAAIINENGDILSPSFFAFRGPFMGCLISNIWRNKYHGCVMALRASLLPEILPLPKGRGILHDVWIGCRSQLSGGRTLYLDAPLVKYRRHGNNVTGISRLATTKRFRNRFNLIIALAVFSLSRRVSRNRQRIVEGGP